MGPKPNTRQPAKKTNKDSKGTSTPTTPIPWPSLTKKKGKVIADISGDGAVYVIDELLSPQETLAIINIGENMGLESTWAPPRKGYAYRDNERVLIQDTLFSEALWQLLRPFVEDLVVDGRAPVGLNDDLRLYRYKPQQRFGPHIDENVPKGNTVSEYTVLFYLTGGTDSEPTIKGGSTTFHSKPPVSVNPRTGRVCVHWQMHNCLHEGEMVERGDKWVLRTDIMYPRARR